LPIGLDVAVLCRSDPVCLGIGTFPKRDLEVGIHGVVNVPIGSLFVGLGIPFDSGFEPFDFVLKREDREAMDLFVILDGLDQTGGDFLEGDGVNIGIGGKYVLHSTRGVA